MRCLVGRALCAVLQSLPCAFRRRWQGLLPHGSLKRIFSGGLGHTWATCCSGLPTSTSVFRAQSDARLAVLVSLPLPGMQVSRAAARPAPRLPSPPQETHGATERRAAAKSKGKASPKQKGPPLGKAAQGQALAKAASAQAATQSPKANSKGASPRGSNRSPGSATPPEPAAGSSSPSGGACSFGTPSPATGSSTATPPPLPLCTPKKRRHPGEHGSPPPPQPAAEAPGPRPAAEAPGTCGGQAGDGGGSPRRAGGRARGRAGQARGRGLRAPCRAAPPGLQPVA
jgi:translation initiation factor IF-2